MEMGFDEKEVIDALRVNNNQQDAAVGLNTSMTVVFASRASTGNKYSTTRFEKWLYILANCL